MRVLALLGALLLPGCTASPLVPSSPLLPATASVNLVEDTSPLTVLVLTQATHGPVADACVWLNGREAARTDASGIAHLAIRDTSDPLIWATADGFQESVHYHDALSGPTESWTFYLWP